jgi:hypothetical protein
MSAEKAAAKTVKVTRAQVEAAKLLVEMARESGESVDPAIAAIAEATILRSRREHEGAP